MDAVEEGSSGPSRISRHHTPPTQNVCPLKFKECPDTKNPAFVAYRVGNYGRGFANAFALYVANCESPSR
jgi:hypothetical protein